MLSLEAANELIWKKFRELPLEHVEVDVWEAVDRIMAEDVLSPGNVPEFPIHV